MTSQVHIAQKAGKTEKVLRWHNFPKKLLLGLEENATLGLFWQGFCPSFSILRIAAFPVAF